jgi:hypothetical protein
MGDSGCLSLFGRKPDQHRLASEHLTAEYRVRTEGRGRTVDEWKLGVDGFDNHCLDCTGQLRFTMRVRRPRIQGICPSEGKMSKPSPHSSQQLDASLAPRSLAKEKL